MGPIVVHVSLPYAGRVRFRALPVGRSGVGTHTAKYESDVRRLCCVLPSLRQACTQFLARCDGGLSSLECIFLPEAGFLASAVHTISLAKPGTKMTAMQLGRFAWALEDSRSTRQSLAALQEVWEFCKGTLGEAWADAISFVDVALCPGEDEACFSVPACALLTSSGLNVQPLRAGSLAAILDCLLDTGRLLVSLTSLF